MEKEQKRSAGAAHVKHAEERLLSLSCIMEVVLKRMRLSQTKLRKEMHISPKTLKKMKEKNVSADVYLRILIFILRHIGPLHQQKLGLSDSEMRWIQKLLKWYDKAGHE